MKIFIQKLLEWFDKILKRFGAFIDTLIEDNDEKKVLQSAPDKETAISAELGLSSSDAPEYRKSKSILTYRERILYRALGKAIDNEYLVMAKVRLADFVWLANEPEDRKHHTNQILCKHVDFLLCGKFQLEPLLVIELDDPSHQWPGHQERDKFKDDTFAAIGVPILRVIMQDSYSIPELSNRIKDAIRENTEIDRDVNPPN